MSITPDKVNSIQHQFWTTWPCEINLEGQADILEEAIKQGTAVAVSDGSYQSDHGAAAWVIESCTSAHRIRGAGQTPGYIQDQGAYCSELFGLWGILYTLKRFTDEHQIKNGQVRIACDGLSALHKAQVTCYSNTMTPPPTHSNVQSRERPPGQWNHNGPDEGSLDEHQSRHHRKTKSVLGRPAGTTAPYSL